MVRLPVERFSGPFMRMMEWQDMRNLKGSIPFPSPA